MDTVEVTDQSRIVILEGEEQTIGILVDSVAEVVYLKASEIDSAPAVVRKKVRFIQGVNSRVNGLLILIDLNKLMSETDLGDANNAESS